MNEAKLKAIEERAAAAVEGIKSEGGGPSGDALRTCADDVPTLVAEVRRLSSAGGSTIAIGSPAPDEVLRGSPLEPVVEVAEAEHVDMVAEVAPSPEAEHPKEHKLHASHAKHARPGKKGK